MPETRKRPIEQRETLPDYKITIVIHRHSEKTSLDGGLTEHGKEATADFFSEAYEGVPPDLERNEGVEIYHSPIDRVRDTAHIAANNYSGGRITSITEDPRLTEGVIASHRDIIDNLGGIGGRWISKWMELTERPKEDIKTGSEVAKDFASFLLEKIKGVQQTGGNKEVDVFSHYPAMIAFLLSLEKHSGQKILPDDWQQKMIHYLESFNIVSDSKDRQNITIYFRRKTIIFPIRILEKIAT